MVAERLAVQALAVKSVTSCATPSRSVSVMEGVVALKIIVWVPTFTTRWAFVGELSEKVTSKILAEPSSLFGVLYLAFGSVPASRSFQSVQPSPSESMESSVAGSRPLARGSLTCSLRAWWLPSVSHLRVSPQQDRESVWKDRCVRP